MKEPYLAPFLLIIFYLVIGTSNWPLQICATRAIALCPVAKTENSRHPRRRPPVLRLAYPLHDLLWNQRAAGSAAPDHSPLQLEAAPPSLLHAWGPRGYRFPPS